MCFLHAKTRISIAAGKLQTTHKVPTHYAPSPFTHAVRNNLDAAFHYLWIGLGVGVGVGINSSIM
jgi:hypothetical protein